LGALLKEAQLPHVNQFYDSLSTAHIYSEFDTGEERWRPTIQLTTDSVSALFQHWKHILQSAKQPRIQNWLPALEHLESAFEVVARNELNWIDPNTGQAHTVQSKYFPSLERDFATYFGLTSKAEQQRWLVWKKMYVQMAAREQERIEREADERRRDQEARSLAREENERRETLRPTFSFPGNPAARTTREENERRETLRPTFSFPGNPAARTTPPLFQFGRYHRHCVSCKKTDNLQRDTRLDIIFCGSHCQENFYTRFCDS
jgi:hypothetical protein